MCISSVNKLFQIQIGVLSLVLGVKLAPFKVLSQTFINIPAIDNQLQYEK